MNNFQSTKVIELGSCAFRQWRASHSHCRFLHGYQLKAKLWFGGSSLDEKNWIVDFGGLKRLKEILQHQFDHTTCVAADDPELELFKTMERQGIIQLRIMAKGVGIERAAEFVWKTADEFVKQLTNNRCWCEKVEVFEHEDNSATYEKDQWPDISQADLATVVRVEDVPVVPQSDRAAPLYCKTDKSLADILAGR